MVGEIRLETSLGNLVTSQLGIQVGSITTKKRQAKKLRPKKILWLTGTTFRPG